MNIKMKFVGSNEKIDVKFDQVTQVTNGNYEKGYADGKIDGIKQGYEQGYEEGLSKRTYETWTITLTDGSIIEKEVALL